MDYSNNKRNMMAGAISVLAILFLMAIAKKTLHLPKPLIIYLGISFVAVSLLFWRHLRFHPCFTLIRLAGTGIE